MLVVPFRVWRSAAKKPKAIFTAIKHSHPDDHSDSTRSDAPQNGLGPELPVDDPPEYFNMSSAKHAMRIEAIPEPIARVTGTSGHFPAPLHLPVHQRGGQDLLVAADTAAMDTTREGESEHSGEGEGVRSPDDPVDVFINIVVVAV